MQPAAFTRPSRPVALRGSRPQWQATLRRIRELGRLALTALVLAVGLGGGSALASAAPASAAEATSPIVVTSRVDVLRPGPGPAAALRADQSAPRALGGTRRPAPTPPAGVGVGIVPLDRPAVDPTGGTLVRRGPPRH
ncbi:hypothetical protein [Micromonospora sp. RTGN7]|uniref:hypothetical protein n=1 Tax=Micromonospora sp. RTGN7 TaxID=3016526 RepID=UPI0029FF3680|nr:hypothetical protein [Micromonospora sp. RTGN7]